VKPAFTPQPTADGSFTFFSPEFNEAFHSHYGAKQEAIYKFVKPCLLKEKASRQDRIVLLDICYGLGYNTAAALTAIWQANPECRVQLIALDTDVTVAQAAIAYYNRQEWPLSVLAALEQLARTQTATTATLDATLRIDDARATIQDLQQQKFQADAIFLDPFSPPQCPQLWTVEFLAKVAACLKADGRLATYSCAAPVRTALQLAGLSVGSTAAMGRKTPGTVASFAAEHIPPLSRREQEHLHTRAAIPYRDRALNNTAAAIIQQRHTEQQNSDREPTSQWKRRWMSQ
jgi:tRNA U34 5-methylaminomethyl-2-thiouridine-forming methyltransferase MnmC